MDITIYNGYYISVDNYPNQTQKDNNARLVGEYLLNLGWTRQAVAGILGNMEVESRMNPAIVEHTPFTALVDNYAILSLPTDTGVGLVQWTGHTDTPPAGQKLASFAIRYNREWYDGDLQCFRLQRECEENIQFDEGTIHGVTYDWDVYISSTAEPEELALVWQTLYERGGSDTLQRQTWARYYYDLIFPKMKPWLLFQFTKRRKEGKPRWLRT